MSDRILTRVRISQTRTDSADLQRSDSKVQDHFDSRVNSRVVFERLHGAEPKCYIQL